MKESFAQAISAAISEEMRRDDTVLVYGEDVAEMGGIFCATKGILEEFGPKRCISTPISEGAIVGSAIGAAMTGLRPCVELMYSDFQLVAFNELFHSCGKWRYLHGEDYKLPLVVRCAGGYSFGAGAEHSNIFECQACHRRRGTAEIHGRQRGGGSGAIAECGSGGAGRLCGNGNTDCQYRGGQ